MRTSEGATPTTAVEYLQAGKRPSRAEGHTGVVLEYQCQCPDGRPYVSDVTQPGGYRQLADLLRQQITTGELRPGQQLPAQPAMAQQYGLSVLTVRRAIDVLRHEGLVMVRHGRTSRVTEPPDLEDVVPPPGATISARPPTAPERDRFGMPVGVSLLVMVDTGGDVKLYPAHRYRFRTPPG